MRILCCLCAPPGNVLGEKCSRCGSTDLLQFLSKPLLRRPDEPLFTHMFYCRACRFHFPEGEGGDSHTYCPAHLAQLRGALSLEVSP